MASPMLLARELERKKDPSLVSWERFRGYGAVGVPFASGHILAFRRVTDSSIGPSFSALWHRDPSAIWTMYVDNDAEWTCARYFGSAFQRLEVAEIETEWEGPMHFSLRVPEHGIQWGMRLASDRVTKGINWARRLFPLRLWERDPVLAGIGRLAGAVLGVGKVALTGTSPNGQSYRISPRLIFRIEVATAFVEDRDLGAVSPHPEQARIGDFWLPNGGIFTVGDLAFKSLKGPRPPQSMQTRDSREPTRPTLRTG